MARYVRFLLLVFYFQIAFPPCLSAATASPLCPNDQSLALLQFKQSMTVDAAASEGCGFVGVPAYPKTLTWNKTIDCCVWEGITCDKLTGQVIGLDLSCSQLQGVIDSNSSLFLLSDHLQSLNLAFNDFSSSSEISPKFGGLASLTYLNLSNSAFTGQLPSEFLHLTNLITLDLASNFQEITFDPLTFRLLLQNLTMLREVSLFSTNISSTIPTNLSVSIAFLNLVDTYVYGTLPEEIFNQPNLQSLRLATNFKLSGQLPVVKSNSTSSLRYLDLSSTGFSGEVLESIGNFKLLNYLDISYCNFWGPIPESLGNLTKLNNLVLSSNNFSGQVPSTLVNLKQLIQLDLSSNNLQGQIPNFLSNFRKLKDLSFADNFFTGQFPSSVINLTQLESLNLSNNSLTGPIPSTIMGFPDLILLFLGDNSFNDVIPSWVFSLPSLKFLDLNSNQLTGQIYDFQYQLLWFIDLRGNQLYGPVPKSFSRLENLTDLFISSNNFSGEVEVSMFSNMNRLRSLDLSYNSLSLITRGVNTTLPESLGAVYLSSLQIKDLDFLRAAKNLGRLDLSNNMIHGIPQWMEYEWGQGLFYLNLSQNFLTSMTQFPFQGIVFLDIRSNLLQGTIFIPPVSTMVFFTSNNNLTGEIPTSICNLSSLIVLDVSNNSLSGAIPQCLGNVSSGLTTLDMHANLFGGKIPATFSAGSNLRSLNLGNNQLEGTIPQSLSNCRQLEVLDLGNNNLNGAFPGWLGTLPNLQVLSLRFNNLHGSVSTVRTGLSFSALRIIDLSFNEFSGVLPAAFFANLHSMMRIMDRTPLTYIGDNDYKDTLTVILKGQEIILVRILTVFTTIDLSSNRFEGVIPDAIGDLISLRGLNLSHNILGGEIPPVLGNLSVLESLDLSANQLRGEIPQQLTALTSLSVLNLSQNHLVGRIPQGNQFGTFQNNSYLGNSGLCGFSLSKSCEGNLSEQSPPPPAASEEGGDKEFMDGFTWKAVLIGYSSGMVAGVVMASLMFLTEKPKWFTRLVDRECKRWFSKRRNEIKWLR